MPRPVLLLNNTQKATAKKEELKREKAEKGASRQTIEALMGMARDELHFIELCAEHADGRGAGLRKWYTNKVNELRHVDGVITTAWRNRPYGTNDLHEALVDYSDQLLEAAATTKPGSAADTELRKQAADVAASAEATELGSSVLAKGVPGCGGMLRKRQVRERLRMSKQEGGEGNTENEEFEQLPCLERGCATFGDSGVASMVSDTASTVSAATAVSIAADSDDRAPVDRRFEAEPPRAAKRSAKAEGKQVVKANAWERGKRQRKA